MLLEQLRQKSLEVTTTTFCRLNKAQLKSLSQQPAPKQKTSKRVSKQSKQAKKQASSPAGRPASQPASQLLPKQSDNQQPNKKADKHPREPARKQPNKQNPKRNCQRVSANKQANNVSDFAIPFYDILILTLPVGTRVHDLARASLQMNWTTSWGPGRILNDLLFSGKRVLPECQKDLVEKKSKSQFRTGKAAAILGTYLFFSGFGKKLMTAGRTPQPKLLSGTSCKLQRFYYKMCELRKANDQSRVLWHRCWKKRLVRDRFEAFARDRKRRLAKPFFCKRR